VRGEARRFWHGPGGGREVLQVGAPLILSHLSFTAQIFLDRLFLTWYAAEAVAGAVTGIFVVYSVVGLCVGTGEYATTFIAQYLGAGRPRRVGAAVWQGVYFALLAGAVIASLHPLLGPLFRAAGHQPLVQAYEHEYARIMMLGAAAPVLMATLSSFFAGRGRTVTVLLVNLAAGALDAFLNWAWIFGHFGFPRWGVSGAAWSSVLAQGFGAALYLAIVLRREHRERFATLAAWRFEAPLFRRLLRYGLPAGLQYSMEVAAFAVFMIVVGRIGTAELAASGIAFNLNMIVFMPMLGLGLAVSSLVGRHLGADHPQAAERVVWSAFALSLAFMTACGLLYVLAPRLLLAPYAAGAGRRCASSSRPRPTSRRCRSPPEAAPQASRVSIRTSEVSVRCTGHLLAISSRRARCSSDSSPSSTSSRSTWSRSPCFVSQSAQSCAWMRAWRRRTVTARNGHCFRRAYMETVMEVQAPRAARRRP
jgi:MATE family multidrug resistance protein